MGKKKTKTWSISWSRRRTSEPNSSLPPALHSKRHHQQQISIPTRIRSEQQGMRERRRREDGKVTDAGNGGGATLDGGGATEEDEAEAVRFGGSNGGKGVAAAGTRAVVVSVPACVQRPVGRCRDRPRFRAHLAVDAGWLRTTSRDSQEGRSGKIGDQRGRRIERRNIKP